MRPSIVSLFNLAKKPKDKNFRNQLYVFLVCIGISIFIWFSIKMSQEYVSDIDYPVRYTNLPKDKVLSEYERKKINLKIKAKGFELLSLKYFTFKTPVKINLANLGNMNAGTRNYILSRNLLQNIIAQLDPDHELLSVSPDTLYFRLEDVISTKVKVIPDLELSFARQYMLYDSLKVDPEYINISGPVSMVDTIKYIYTTKKTLSNLNKDRTEVIDIERPIKSRFVRYSTGEVEISLQVEKFTEETIEVPVEVLSVEENLKIKTFPKFVSLTYLVALKDFERVDRNMFRVTAQYNPQANSQLSMLNVALAQSPSFVRVTKINPEKVEFILMK